MSLFILIFFPNIDNQRFFPQLTEDDLLQMALELPVVPRYTLNRYWAPDKFLHTDEVKVMKKPYSEEMIVAFTESLRAIQPNIMI